MTNPESANSYKNNKEEIEKMVKFLGITDGEKNAALHGYKNGPLSSFFKQAIELPEGVETFQEYSTAKPK